ncbi:hypothetical protein IWW48_000734 [Coemansia sp. RSA 1200]|nr:hypothetical protein IWW48_000734 [Coemansia sp. RSA 1200]
MFSTLLTQRSTLAHSSDWAFKQLFKLESECRSQMPAMQVKAIGQFPKLLDQFPFPTLVSSAFLKLGDMFRSSPNSMRYHIAQVFESSQHHLVQVTHTEELLKRVISVLYSNDPIARVLALRLIGNASVVFARYPEAQHGVFLRYQSTHPLEIAATVQTTELMLKYSPELLNIVWETIISKANDSKVPDPVRAQLIRSLQHAASSLQLSVCLYSYCRSWVSNTESTTIIRLAALYTWRVIIQPHNELRLEDAAIVAGYISHSTDAISKASLALLSKWRYNDQTTTNSLDPAAISVVKQKLNDYVGAQLDYSVATADFRSIRLAMVTLSHLGSAPEQTGISKCWELVEAICAYCLRVLRGEIPNTTSILDSIEKGTVDIDVRDSECSELDVSTDRAKLLLQQAQGPFHRAKPIVHDVAESRAFHAFVCSVMTAVNVASISKVAAVRQAASIVIASAWIIQQNSLSSKTREWLDAIKMLADAESKSEDTDFYEKLTSRTLCALLTLNRQADVQNRYQQLLIQLRKEFISVIGGWKQICSTDQVRPSIRYATKYLSERIYTLADQANYITSSFVYVDRITRSWIDDIRSTTSHIVHALASLKPNNDVDHSRIQQTCGAVGLCIDQHVISGFIAGPSFFFRHTNPEISIETQPDLESSSPIVVYSGSQFHFTVEGFIRHSIKRISVAFQRINVSVWLSRHSFSENSSYDLQSCTHFNAIAWNKHRGNQKSCDLLSATENDDASWSKIWNSANIFTANIESTYFACPCTVAMPSLHSLFGHVDTDMAVHIHVACALADASGNVYYVGPHKSYPLTVSTTVKP